MIINIIDPNISNNIEMINPSSVIICDIYSIFLYNFFNSLSLHPDIFLIRFFNIFITTIVQFYAFFVLLTSTIIFQSNSKCHLLSFFQYFSKIKFFWFHFFQFLFAWHFISTLLFILFQPSFLFISL